MNKIYICYDKITGNENAVFMAENDLDVVRNMVLSGYFKINRLIDTTLYDVGISINKKGMCTKYDGFPKEVEVIKCLEELSIQIEKDMKKIEGNEQEVEKKIKDSVKKLDKVLEKD